MKADFCIWCDKPVTLPDEYNPLLHAAVCKDPRCRVIEHLFTNHFSNKAILDREHMEDMRKRNRP